MRPYRVAGFTLGNNSGIATCTRCFCAVQVGYARDHLEVMHPEGLEAFDRDAADHKAATEAEKAALHAELDRSAEMEQAQARVRAAYRARSVAFEAHRWQEFLAIGLELAAAEAECQRIAERAAGSSGNAAERERGAS